MGMVWPFSIAMLVYQRVMVYAIYTTHVWLQEVNDDLNHVGKTMS